MSDDSPSPPESRPRLRLRTDKTAGGAPPASTGLQSPAPGENHPPEAPPPAPSAPPVSPREPVAASPAPPAPLPVRLKPRISIRPAESERAGETIAPPGSQPALPRIGSDLPAPPAAAGKGRDRSRSPGQTAAGRIASWRHSPGPAQGWGENGGRHQGQTEASFLRRIIRIARCCGSESAGGHHSASNGSPVALCTPDAHPCH